MKPNDCVIEEFRLPTAVDYLDMAASAIADRASQRDQPCGERSMARAVSMFNALRGTTSVPVSETDGWLFMALLKMSRAKGGKFCDDDYLDMAAYCALAGESAAREDDRPF
jgi:hypothetical protein